MNKVTMEDVAKHADVSKSTVSQYINGRYEYMSKKTKQRVEESIEELNYSVNIVAKSLKQKRTFTIGVIVANIIHNFSTQVIRAVEDVCNKKNIHVIVCNADDDPEKEQTYIELLLAKQIDGLIVFPIDGNIEYYKKLYKAAYPIVFVDRKIEQLPIDTFLLNNEGASEMAVDHFVSKGYREIGFVSSSLTNVTPRIERLEGFKKALVKHNVEVNKDYIISCKVKNIRTELKKMLLSDRGPKAILASNDLSLIETLKFLNQNNLSIPHDVALIGIDDVPFSDIIVPSLTTVAQPSYVIGENAASKLLDIINNRQKKRSGNIYRFDGELISRNSC